MHFGIRASEGSPFLDGEEETAPDAGRNHFAQARSMRARQHDRQHADAAGLDQEGMFLGAMDGAAITRSLKLMKTPGSSYDVTPRTRRVVGKDRSTARLPSLLLGRVWRSPFCERQRRRRPRDN
jgi:hypothetical protein